MAIDPSIALGYRPPQINIDVPSPLQQFGQMMSLRQMMEQSQARQQDMRAQQMKMDTAQQEMQAAADKRQRFQNFQDLWKDGATPTQQQVYSTLGTEGTNVLKEMYEAKTKEQALQLDQTKRLGSYTSSILNNPDPINYKYNISQAVKNGDLDRDTADQLLTMDVKDPRVQGMLSTMRDNAMNATEQQTFHFNDAVNKFKVLKETSDAQKAQLEAAQKQKEADAQALAGALQSGGPKGYADALANLPVERRSLFAGTPGIPIDVMKRALTPEQAVTEAGQAATRTETAKQHAAQNAFEQARVNLEAAKNKREQDTYNQTYGPGANQSLVGVEAKLRVPATKEAQKAGEDYLKTSEAADQMQSMIDMARAGNKAAGSNLPLVGVETLNAINGIKRINRQEIEQYQGAGSLLDEIKGKIGKLAVGQAIPADVMNDIEKMHNMLRQNADSSYRARLDSINQNYHSNFTPVKTPSRTPPASTQRKPLSEIFSR